MTNSTPRFSAGAKVAKSNEGGLTAFPGFELFRPETQTTRSFSIRPRNALMVHDK